MQRSIKKFFSVPSYRNSCIAVAGLLAASSASAAVSEGAVAAINSAQGEGESVGTAVVTVVAALAVVGIVIALIRKV